MPGSSVLRQVLSSLFEEEHHPPYSFTVTAVRNYHSLQLTSPSFHTILVFILPALLDLLQLLYKDGSTSPFTTHPKTMRFAIGCLLAYCIFYCAELRFSSRHLRHGMMLSGSTCVMSLSSIFFGNSSQWFLYMLYTLLWTAMLWSSLSPIIPDRLPGQVELLVRPIWDRWRGLSVFRRHTFRLRGNILPL